MDSDEDASSGSDTDNELVDNIGPSNANACGVVTDGVLSSGAIARDEPTDVVAATDAAAAAGGTIASGATARDEPTDVVAATNDAVAFAWAFGPMREGAAAKLLGVIDSTLADDIRKEFRDARQRAFALDPATTTDKTRKLVFKQQVRNTLSVRLAIGISFNQHKEDAINRGETQYVKTFVNEHFKVKYCAEVKERLRRCGALAKSQPDKFRGARGKVTRARPAPGPARSRPVLAPQPRPRPTPFGTSFPACLRICPGRACANHTAWSKCCLVVPAPILCSIAHSRHARRCRHWC